MNESPPPPPAFTCSECGEYTEDFEWFPYCAGCWHDISYEGVSDYD